MPEPELIPAPATNNGTVTKLTTRNALVEDVAFGRLADQQRLSSYDPNTAAGLMLEVLLSSPTDLKAAESDGQVLEVVNWLVGRRVLPDPETGEPREGPFLAFSLAGEKTWGTGSAGAIRSWSVIVANKGPGPYDPPLQLMVKHTRLSGGRPYYILLPITGLPQ